MKYTIFGESHGPAIGVVLEGVPAGLELDLNALRADMARRAPGKSALSTARKETDEVNIISGFFEGKTTGAPLAMVIQNSDQHSGDYDALRYTPGPPTGILPDLWPPRAVRTTGEGGTSRAGSPRPWWRRERWPNSSWPRGAWRCMPTSAASTGSWTRAGRTRPR